MPLLLTLPLPTAETQPRTTAGKQLTNSPGSKESSIPPCPPLPKRPDSRRGEVTSPGPLCCPLPPTPLAPQLAGPFLPIPAAGMGRGQPTALQIPLGGCTVSPTPHTSPTLPKDFSQKFSTNGWKGWNKVVWVDQQQAAKNSWSSLKERTKCCQPKPMVHPARSHLAPGALSPAPSRASTTSPSSTGSNPRGNSPCSSLPAFGLLWGWLRNRERGRILWYSSSWDPKAGWGKLETPP